jgi:glycerol transport system permease protein
MNKTVNNRAWLLVLPVVLSVAFSAIIPLMTVVNYSIQDVLGPNQRVFVGGEWFRDVLRDPEIHAAFFRQLFYSLIVLLIEVPLGIAVALAMPRTGWRASLSLVLIALPLLIPWNVVGTIWQIFGRADIGLAGHVINGLGIPYNYTSNARDAWLTVLVMDVWHWTPLVALMCYAGLRAIPDAFYQAARIDGASSWKVFRFIQLPKLRGVLVIAVLLRFMDSFMIYTEPFVLTGGGPGDATTFLSQILTRMAVGQFDVGKAAAFSLIYFLIIQALSYIFYTVIQNMAANKTGGEPQ